MDITNKECCGCGLCATVCPKACISMKLNDEGFYYPSIDESVCIKCSLCSKHCPLNNEDKNKPSLEYECFYAISADSDNVLKSSSGGIFSLLAKKTLSDNGVVVGAAFDYNFNVEMKIVDNLSKLNTLMQAKYVQATLPTELYKKIKTILSTNQKVLFTGTPCQIAALKSYLSPNTYDNLLCAELICHGVPSPGVWQSYLKYLTNQTNQPIKEIFFRDKKNGWHDFALTIKHESTELSESHKKSPYMQLFLKDIISRNSCSSCSFKGGKSGADLSLGDFWKLSKIAPKLDNNTGASMVIVHSEKGKDLIESCNFSVLKKFDNDCINISNRAFFSSIANNKLRKAYFSEFKSNNFNWFNPSKYITKPSSIQKIIQKIKNIFN